MTQPEMAETTPAPSDRMVDFIPDGIESVEAAPAEATIVCTACQEPATQVCYRCGTALCEAHSFREAGGTRAYCRACADAIVGVCDVCDALHARPCKECGKKVCEVHQKRVIERWGWGGAPGQGGVTSWFPVMRTYCQEHGQNRLDVPKPNLRTMVGYDGSSPEW